MKICIIIPVHNESDALKSLIPSIQNHSSMDIVVVDDGSEDHSDRIAEGLGVTVLKNEKKCGKGFSLRRGFDYAKEKEYDGVLTMDGDGQHLPSDIAQFLNSSDINDSAVINGNRMNNSKAMPFVRLWTNRFMSGIISLACRKKIPDTQCGFRFIGKEVLKAVNLNSNGFEIETEILMKANKKRFAIHSVDITTVYQNEKSKINPFIDTIRFFSYFFKELFS